MSALLGTENTTETLGVGETFASSLTSNNDIDWIALDAGSYSEGTRVYSPYLIVTGDVDLSNAQVALYSRTTNWSGQTEWSTQYLSVEEAADGLPRRISIPDSAGSDQVFLSLTGFTGAYSATLGDGSDFFDDADDDHPGYISVTLGQAVSTSLDHSQDIDQFTYDGAIDGHFYKITITPDASILADDLNLAYTSSGYTPMLQRVWDGDNWHLEATFQWHGGASSISSGVGLSLYDNTLQTFSTYDITYEIVDLGTTTSRNNLSEATAQNINVGTTYSDPIDFLSMEKFYSFAALPGVDYLVYTNIGGYYGSIDAATAMQGGVEHVVIPEDDYYYDPDTFTVEGLTSATTVTFSVTNDAMQYNSPDLEITVVAINDAFGSTSETAFALTLDQPVVEDYHYSGADYEDVDTWSLDVVAGETYTITLDFAAGIGFSPRIQMYGGAAYSAWESGSDRSSGHYHYTIVATETGTVTGYVAASQSPLGASYTITATAGAYDDRAAVWSDLAGPINLNEVTSALASGPADNDGFVFNIVSGQSYTVLVNDPGAWVDFHTDADGDGWLSYYVNEYKSPGYYDSFGAGFVDQAAQSGLGLLNFTKSQVDGASIVTFTADYTGLAGVNIYPGTNSGQYSVFITESAITDTTRALMELSTDAADILEGDARDDTLSGYGGDDLLRGNGGDDTLSGGDGNDTISGNSGADTMRGDNGNDRLFGGSGNDTISGNGGMDILFGGYGDDRLFGGSQDDNLNGDEGDDRLDGGSGNDLLRGLDDNDTLWGRDGQDTLSGNGGDDSIFGGGGDDLAFGGSGADNINGGSDNDLLNGGAQNDLLRGENGNDALNGDGGDDTLSGGAGKDVLRGGDGDDRLFGGSEADALSGNNGNDLLRAGDGNDRLFGGDGDDALNGDAGNDRLDGGLGGDILRGGDGNDILLGRSGNDTLSGNDGADDLAGGAQDDHLFGGAGNDTLDGGLHSDTLNGGSGTDMLTGGDGADVFVFNHETDSIHGSGRDTISDFAHNLDQIDLSGIMSDLSFIGTGAYSNTAGEVRYNDSIGRLYIDTDGSGGSDFSIAVIGAPTIDSGDLIL